MVTSATLRNVRISPRKVRLVADLIRGKSVDEVTIILTHLPKGSALPLLILLRSAVANAKQRGKDDTALLRISKITVDMAPRLKRFMPHAMQPRHNHSEARVAHYPHTGRAHPEGEEG